MPNSKRGQEPDPAEYGKDRVHDPTTGADHVMGADQSPESPPPTHNGHSKMSADQAATVRLYLTNAVDRGVISSSHADVLLEDLRAITPPPPPRPQPPLPTAVHRATANEDREPLAPLTPIKPEPGLVARWLKQTADTIRGDLGVHGLAYLGVLLVFAGMAGLILFSFGDLSAEYRALSEFAAPTVLLASGWFLYRREATVVSSALVLVGGAMVPLSIFASLTDGTAIPPDLSGKALPIAQAITTVLIATAMGVGANRHRWLTPTRVLMGPLVWIGMGFGAAVVLDTVPTGTSVVQLQAFQLAVVGASIALTAIGIRVGGKWGPASRSTLAAVGPASVVVYVLETLASGFDQWPVAPTIIMAIAVVVSTELVTSSRLRQINPIASLFSTQTVSIAQIAVVAIAGLRLTAHIDPAWVGVGVAGTTALLVEYFGWRQASSSPTYVGLSVIALSLGASLQVPEAAMVGFGAVGLWALARRIRPPSWVWFKDEMGLGVAVPTIMAASQFAQVGPPGVVAITLGSATLAIATAGHLWTRVRQDQLWLWFAPSVSAMVALIQVGLSADTYWFVEASNPDLVWASTFGLIMAGAGFGLSSSWMWTRVWVVAGFCAVALTNMSYEFEIDAGARTIGTAVFGFAIVILAMALAHWRASTKIAHHVAFVGHTVALAAVGFSPGMGWPMTAAVGLLSAGLLATVVVNETIGAVHIAWLRRSFTPVALWSSWADDLAVFVSMATTAITGPLILDTIIVDGDRLIAIDNEWATISSATVGLVWAAAFRLARWNKANLKVTVFGALAISNLSSVVTGARSNEEVTWAVISAVGLAVVTVFALPSPRPRVSWWLAWINSAIWAMLFANQLGLDPDWADTALAGWGALAVLVAVGYDRLRNGPAPITPSSKMLGYFTPGSIRWPHGDAPAVLGSIALVAGGSASLTYGTQTEVGWVAVGLGIAVAAIALVSRWAELGVAAQSLGVVAYLSLAPWEPIDHPWTIVALGAVALALAGSIGWLADRSDAGTESLRGRWAVVSFVTANAVLAIGVLAAIDVPAPSRLAALVGAGAIWTAIALAPKGWPFTLFGSVALVAAWFQLTIWQQWSDDTVFASTVCGAASVALATSLSARLFESRRSFSIIWMATGAATLIGQVSVSDLSSLKPVMAGTALGLSLVGLSVAVGIVAAIVHSRLRYLSALIATMAWPAFLWANNASVADTAIATTAAALMVFVSLSAARALTPASGWLKPGLVFGAVTQLVGTAAAISQLPDQRLLAVVLLAIAIELVAAAVTLSIKELFVAAPVIATAAWLVYAADAVSGEPNWFTVPIGAAMLVTTALTRWIRSSRGGNRSASEIVILECVGMSFTVGAAMVQTITGDLWKGLLAVGIGALIGAWGTITQTRWRAAFGVLAVLTSVSLMIGVPVVRLDVWTGPMLWITVIVCGLLAVVIATTIERNRDRVQRLVSDLDNSTKDWEHW